MADKQVVLGSCNEQADWLFGTYYVIFHWLAADAHLQAGTSNVYKHEWHQDAYSLRWGL